MERDFWKGKIQYFLTEHSSFKDTEEEVLTPEKGLKIRFWIEGNLQIEGEFEDLEINYNDPDLLILAKRNEDSDNIFRIPWHRLISVELITGDETSSKLKKLVRLN